MTEALIEGEPATLAEAVDRAAHILSVSRFPVLAGMGTDIAGARAAIRLAERLRGAVDHAAQASALGGLSLLSEGRSMNVAPIEARLRADLILLAGPMPEAENAGVLTHLLEMPRRGLPDGGAGRRDVIALCAGQGREPVPVAGLKIEKIGDDADLLPTLSALRARLAGRPCGDVALPREALDALAKRLAAAHYGVAVWSAAHLDELTTDTLARLVDDLNAATRWSGLPLGGSADVTGVNLAAGWLTGYPLRTGFGRGFAEHDPWRFDAKRLVASGEADAAIWIAALGEPAPDWKADIPLVALVALVAGEWPSERRAEVVVRVGRPGKDHDAVLYDARIGALAPVGAAQPTNAPSVAAVLDRIARLLPC